MPVTTENIRRWIEQSDIDYITYFIKAWIPFNAWYNAHYESLDSDRAKINAIKTTASDPIRKGIDVYLENENQTSQVFKSYLSDLHYALEQNPLDSREGRISFKEITKEKNAKNQITNEKIRRINYFLKREDSGRLGEVTSMQIFLKDDAGTTFFSYSHNSYDYDDLQNKRDRAANFSKLSSSQQENLRLFFKELEPILIVDLIESSPSETPKNYYKCDTYNFKRDLSDSYCRSNLVCKALVETLYQLRNILFHGELIPSENIQPYIKMLIFF